VGMKGSFAGSFAGDVAALLCVHTSTRPALVGTNRTNERAVFAKC